jgi:cytochrome c oxidase subunit 2
MTSHPMSYLHTYGPAADPVTRLGWGMGVVSVLVVLIISGLLLGGILRRRDPALANNSHPLDVGRQGNGMRWIYIGVGVSSVVLVGLGLWTLLTIAAVSRPPAATAFTVRVTGYQWWWRVRYEGKETARTFTTANEIHIPVGQPIRLELESADVIHSFWVPQLGGKTDTIPGQTNVSWIQADRPGVYRGQCGEYCGAQHAHMALLVVADAPDAFNAWWNAQLASVDNSILPAAALDGESVFTSHCAACHAVRGTGAGGIVGPDLTHLMSRHTIASGKLPNDSDHLAEWIRHAPQLKPGSRMPSIALSDAELKSVLSFLQILH